jgi:hypothetical protein
LGVRFATPIFDGASTDQIEQYCKDAGIPKFGHTYLYDGETGERFHQKATVGVIYMIKLHHMVDDKMHARSIGPYSLLLNNRWVVKHSLVVSVLVRWRFGHWKHMVHQISLRNY